MARPKTAVSEYKGLMVRLPASTLEAFKALAKQQRRSLNAQLIWVIEASLKDEEGNTHACAGSRHDDYPGFPLPTADPAVLFPAHACSLPL